MSYIKPAFSHPDSPVNEVGYKKADYRGAVSTLCAGCGHDSISGAIIQACFEMSIEPHRLAKISGIGCSSKTPTYFLSNSHGFNSVHGRMPSVTTGANLANKDLIYLGVSGDGDSASIGMGQFVHVIRRNVNMTYIVMNNGCYGLTKGQNSATADLGSTSKGGEVNPYNAIDLANLALQLDGGFIARSFSGDKDQLVPLIKAAINHPGFALIDIISPCVTFNNNSGSTKSYEYTREFSRETAKIDYVPEKEEITVDYKEGETIDVVLHDGSLIRLNKPTPDWDPGDRISIMKKMVNAELKGEILTGLLYIDPYSQDLHTRIHTTDTPLNVLKEEDLCPGNQILGSINQSFR
ncbi:MAG: 2-oxoacid:ferredoxin oxidoreductase subunit beta [Saprospiraceae bacterium]|nr:2-oxoacid:ferredoxin oxidoreductase subunit beta [Bacteroidia bacterium]MBT8229306.1 2-oxoacid:ferredoxin oxidoreductase subunit beta [Bacteroidia bacterium]NNF21406.1 2-oxoacid:ferredoxin oxidoreductase subunit beta [Saprospiraceae bacterium]NNK89737.1 2-oxoacid:ferredoxin oxidoreductase subunit beta [Saprospiraceae bacterium]